jgi:hypothetical protein
VTQTWLRLRNAVFRASVRGLSRIGISEDQIDLRDLKARDFDLKIEINQPLKFDGE